MTNKKIFLVLLVILILSLSVPTYGAEKEVYVAPVSGIIDGGMYAFLEKVYTKAEDNSGVVVLEIDTPGGFINYAENISELIRTSDVHTTAFVKNKALSAGALIALSSDKLVMTPGSIMGAAEPRIGDEKADNKTVSAWSKSLAAAATANGRNEELARAMADSDIEIPGIVKKGELLTLTYKEALEHDMADAVVDNRTELLNYLNLENAEIIEEKPGFFSYIVGWVTNPYISAILLTVGIAGLVIEIFTVGFGIPGGIGLLALGLYFLGHIFAGLTGIGGVFLFLLGIILLATEVFLIPGFGITGIAGIISLILSIVVAAPSVEQAIISIVIAIIVTIILLALSIKFLPTRNIWKRLILSDKQEKETYLAPKSSLKELVGKTGKTLTPLRPSGAVLIDGERIDVVTSGQFIDREKPIKVIEVEGNRVVVEEIKN